MPRSLCLLLVLLAPALRAQQTAAPAPSEAAQTPVLRYAAVLTVADDAGGVSARVAADGWGAAVGDRGEVWSAAHRGSHDLGSQLLGTAEVVAVDEAEVTVRVVLDRPGAPEAALYPGDLVVLPVVLPEGTYHGALLRTALFGITWRDRSGAPLFTPEELRAVRTADDAVPLLERFAADLRATAAELADAFAADSQYAGLREPRPAGPYAGRSVVDLLRAADAETVAAYLDFVLTFPGRYVGGAWKGNETFATWALNDSPYGSETLLYQAPRIGDDALLEAYGFAPEVYAAAWEAWAARLAPSNSGSAETLRAFAAELQQAHEEAQAAAASGDYGYLLIVQGRLTEAAAYYERLLDAAVAAGDRWWEAASHRMLATVHVRSGAFETGLGHWARADSLYGALGDELARANALFPKCNALFFQGRYREARETVQQMLGVYAAAGQEPPPQAVTGIGETYLEEGDAAAAEPWMEEGLAVARRLGDPQSEGFALLNLGRVRHALGRTDEAEADLRAALPLSAAAGDEETAARTWNALARLLLDTGRVDEAEAALAGARTRGVTTPHFNWEPLYTLALVRIAQGRDAEAVALLEEAVDAIEGLRVAVLGGPEAGALFAGGGPRARVYQTLIETYQRLGRPDDVVRTTLRWHQETTAAQQRSARAAVDDPRVQAVVAQERQRRNAVEVAEQAYAAAVASGDDARIEAAVNVRTVAEADYRRFVREVIGSDPALARLIPQGVDLQNLVRARAAIPDDAVVLLYMVGPDRLFAVAATRTETTVKDVAVPYDSVNAYVRDLRAHLRARPGAAPDRTEVLGAPADPPARSMDEAAAWLYAHLIAPVEAALAGRARVAVIPGGPLQLLPFAVLRERPDAPYLVERFILSVVPNFNPFGEGPAAAGLRIRAFGNPDGSLPNTVAEVDDLQRLYPDAEVYLGGEATEDLAKRVPEAINVLHFATHGNLAARIEDSHLTLAPNAAAGEDGALTLNEMDPLVDERAAAGNLFRLVTLSACDTAVGNLEQEGWPFNPASQFLAASRAVVASLWAVDDAATARLMSAFYRGLAGADAAAALQAAQRALMADETYRHPYYWAPFVLFGEDR